MIKTSKNSIFIGNCLSDQWIENQYSKISTNISEDKYLVLDFSRIQWVELSALVTLIGIVLNNIKDIKSLDLLFKSADLSNKCANESFSFMVGSNFFTIVNYFLSKKGKKCRIWFALPQTQKYNFIQIKSKLIRYLKSRAQLSRLEEFVDNAKTKDNIQMLGMNLDYLDKNKNIDHSLFHPLGYRRAKYNDRFVIPFTHWKRQHIKDLIKNTNKQDGTDIGSLIDTMKLSLSEEIHLHRLIDDLGQIWLFELLLNAVEHGGDDIVFVVRMGDWEVRDREIEKQKIYYHGYTYRYKFLEEDGRRVATQFFDLFVLDTGKGFISLKDAFTSEKNVSKNFWNKEKTLSRLHRFALFPNSTSKHITKSQKDPFPITGLGLIAEKVIEYEGVLSIKDCKDLTYFDSLSLKELTGAGKKDHVSKSDYSFTVVSSIIPVPSESWATKSGVRTLPLEENEDLTDFYYIEFDKTGLVHTASQISLNKDGEHYGIEKINITQILKSGKSYIAVFDISNTLYSFNKIVALRLVKNILNLRKKSFPVIVYGADTAIMRIFQNIFESGEKLRQYGEPPITEKEYLICPIISPEIEIFFCGALIESLRLMIFKHLVEGNVNTFSRILLEKWGYTEKSKLPFRNIERCINKYHGIKLQNDLKNYTVHELVEDIHGKYLDRFYEVKSYLKKKSNRRKWYPDIRRIISTERVEVVLTDCSEIRALIHEASREINNRNIIVGLFHHGQVEWPVVTDKLKGKKTLCLVSCIYSGNTLKKITHNRQSLDLDIASVIAFLDLTDNPTKINEKDIGCKFDKIAKATPPTKIIKTKKIPKYVVSDQARLIPNYTYNDDSDELFISSIKKNAIFPILLHSKKVACGHILEQQHHYDVFIDVRSIMSSNETLNHYYKALIQSRISSGATKIVYPEESELWSIIETFQRTTSGKKGIEFIPTRRVIDDIYIWAERKTKIDICDEHVIFIDEGAYTCSSILGNLKFILENRPSKIDVIVLEKRIARKNYIYDLKGIKDINKGVVDIQFYCVLDIKSPCWNEGDCPYCKCKTKKESIPIGRSKYELNVDDYYINRDVDFYLWFLGEIYRGRMNAVSAINKVQDFEDKYQKFILLAAKLIIIHSDEIDRLNLHNLAYEIVEYSLPYGNEVQKITLLKKAIHTRNTMRTKYFIIIFKSIVYNIDDVDVYTNVFEILHDNDDLLDDVNIILNNITMPEKKRNLWNELIKNIEYGILPKMTEEFFALTKINKAKPHITLAEQIEKYGFSKKDVSVKIESLSIVLNYLGENILPVKVLKDHLQNQDSIVEKLKGKEFVIKITNSLSISGGELIEKITNAIGEKHDEKGIEKIINKRESGGEEMPYVCMRDKELTLLLDYLKENRHHGRMGIEYELNEEGLVIDLTTAQQIRSEKKERLERSISRRHTKNILRNVGCDFGYSIVDNKLKFRLIYKVVDHVEI